MNVSTLFPKGLAAPAPRAWVEVLEVEVRPAPAVEPSTGWRVQRRIMRLVDVLGAAVGGLLILPFCLLIALAIKLDSPGPALFVQERVGKGERAFPMFKFRTMGVDAERRRTELEEANEGTGPLFKVRNDPRVTRVGRFLRAFSLDELPQLLNVLRGEMALVGPRPLPCSDWSQTQVPTLRHTVLPGLTGLWQVSGRSETTGEAMVALDDAYVLGWSLLYDLGILFRTVGVVLSRRGAY